MKIGTREICEVLNRAKWIFEKIEMTVNARQSNMFNTIKCVHVSLRDNWKMCIHDILMNLHTYWIVINL